MVDELIFVVPAGGSVDLTHHHFKFLFLLNGEINHEIDGIESGGVLREGDILVAPPVRFHRYVNPDETREARIHVVRLFLDSSLLKQSVSSAQRKPEADLCDFILHHFDRPMHLVGAIGTDLRASLLALRRETEMCHNGFRHRVRSLCSDLIVFTARLVSEQSREQRGSHAGQTVAEAMEFVQKHFTDPELRLGTIAWHTGKGDEHLARLFKRETGRSVFEYVREIRINHAKTLMLNPSTSLTKVAEACGFQSLAFFSRTFKQLVGLSPSAYRRTLELELRSGPLPSPRKTGGWSSARP